MEKNIIRDGCCSRNKGAYWKLYKAYIFPSLLLFFLLAAGCNKEPEYLPGQSVQGIRAPISKVLFSPIAFDGAVLKIEGYIVGLIVEGQLDGEDAPSEAPGLNEDDSEDLTTLFKLMDTKGNYINIILPGTWEIYDDDYVIVGGTYRNNGNELEAHQFDVVEFEEDEREEEIQKRDDW
jgi:hypothetical protein